MCTLVVKCPLSSVSTKWIRYQKTLHAAKIYAVIRVHYVEIPKLEVLMALLCAL